MYVGQAAALFRQTTIAAGSQAKTGNQIVDMLNQKSTPSPLEDLQAKVANLRDKLNDFTDPDMEKILSGYQQLAYRCQSSQEELTAQQGQLNQFQALSDQYGTAQKDLEEAQQGYQDALAEGGAGFTPDAQAAMEARISDLTKSLSKIGEQLDQLVADNNRSAQSGSLALFGADGADGPYTRENFADQMGGKVASLQKEVAQNKDAMVDYCRRYGLTTAEMEAYLSTKEKLSADFSAAKQDLYTVLLQEGENKDHLLDELA